MAVASKKLTTRPVTKKPITRAKVKSIDDKYYGPEPIVVTNHGAALNWYNYMHEQEQAREWFIEYLKKNHSKEAVNVVRTLPKWKVPTTVGWLSRMIMNGNKLSDSSMEFLQTHINELLASGKVEKVTIEEKADKPTVSIRERVLNKNQLMITECEEAVDTNPKLNVYEWLKTKEATPQAAAAIREYYSNWIPDFEYQDEFETRVEKKARLEQLKYWQQFIDDCDRYVGNKKVTKVRKPRERKQKSAVDLVKSLKFQKEFAPLKIVSVTPTDIIGCQQLWTYNTKYRKLTRYDASGPSGIQVKGTTLLGFDAERSMTKSIRKPEETIQELLGAGKVMLRKFMDEIKTNTSIPNGRINTDTVLLRVIK